MAVLQEFECPACGGGLSFDSASQKVKCPYCDTEFSVDAIRELQGGQSAQPQEEPQWQTSQEENWEQAEQVNTYICQSCGGELLCDANTAATSCPYCDNPVVLSHRVAGSLRPDLVIPFQLDKEAAKAALLRHYSGKPLLPKCFKSENRLEKLQGVYVPFWLFDTDVDGDICFRATKVRTWSDSNYHYTQTRHYSVRRAGSVSFQGVPVDGSNKMANDLMESIEPYDLSKAVDFETAYLAGYLADKYDVSAEAAAPRANERIRTSTVQAMESTVHGYSSVQAQNSDIRLSGCRVRYALLPVWMLTARYRDKDYIFAMNGQTGKMVGDLPCDKGAWWRWFALISLAGAAIAYLIGLLLG